MKKSNALLIVLIIMAIFVGISVFKKIKKQEVDQANNTAVVKDQNPATGKKKQVEMIYKSLSKDQKTVLGLILNIPAKSFVEKYVAFHSALSDQEKETQNKACRTFFAEAYKTIGKGENYFLTLSCEMILSEEKETPLTQYIKIPKAK